MNAMDGSSEAQGAKEGASADSAEEMKDTTGVSSWRLHCFLSLYSGQVLPLLLIGLIGSKHISSTMGETGLIHKF